MFTLRMISICITMIFVIFGCKPSSQTNGTDSTVQGVEFRAERSVDPAYLFGDPFSLSDSRRVISACSSSSSRNELRLSTCEALIKALNGGIVTFQNESGQGPERRIQLQISPGPTSISGETDATANSSFNLGDSVRAIHVDYHCYKGSWNRLISEVIDKEPMRKDLRIPCS